MAYTDAEEVEGDFKDIDFATAENITTDIVEQYIVESDSLINSYIGTVYQLPIDTAAGGFQLLKLLSRSLTAARIKKVMEVKTDGGDAAQNVVGVLLSRTAVIEILENLQKKSMSLDGAVGLTRSGGFYSNNVANEVEPVMLKNTKQW